MPFMKKEGYGMANSKIQKYSQELKQENSKRMKKTKRKNGVRRIFAIIGGIILLGGGFLIGKHSKNFKPSNEKDSYSISSTDLSDLGKELDSKSNKKTKDKKDKNNGYVESNGKLYADQESAKNANKVGTSTVDTKGGKLTVDSNGKVKEKETGYEIKDEDGEVIASGNETSDGKVDGFEKNEEIGESYEKGDIDETDTIADSNYYDEDGNLIIAKGELVKKSFLEHAKQNLSTTKPAKKQEETQASTSAPAPTSKAGTYTDSYGNVWNSYQDYLNGIDNMDGIYVDSNGILYGTPYSNNNTENYQNTK